MAGIYLHIPFCKRKCSYCDFYSVANTRLADEYVSALVRELHIRAAEIDFDCVTTIYIGGGTPSVLTLAQMHKLMQGLREKVNFANVSEVTIEVNPDDVTEDYISGLKALGVNRVSMGVQSFVDAELKAVNRRHNAAEAITAVEAIRRAGIGNVGSPYCLNCRYRLGCIVATIYSLQFGINKRLHTHTHPIHAQSLQS